MLLTRGLLFYQAEGSRGEQRGAELLFHIQLQSSASKCADKTSFPLICQCVGPPE